MEKLSRFVPKPILGLAARSLLAASLLGGCGVAPPESKTSSEGKTNSPQTSSLDDSNLHLPYWGLGYLTAGGGGDHVEHIDLASPQGGSCKDNPKLIIETWPVRAIMAGVVTEVGDENNLSDPNHSVVGIIHPNGLLSESEHLAKIKVKPGQQVKTGDELGFTSCEHRPTDFNTGPHVDLSIKRNGKTVSFDKEFPLSGWVQHSAKTNHDGTMTKDGQETRVANSNHCNCKISSNSL